MYDISEYGMRYFWRDRLEEEERRAPPFRNPDEFPTDKERTLRRTVRHTLDGRLQDNDDQIPRLYLELAGNRIAREKNYRLHRGLDALRYHLWSDHDIPLSEAMSLSVDTLLWIFAEIDPITS